MSSLGARGEVDEGGDAEKDSLRRIAEIRAKDGPAAAAAARAAKDLAGITLEVLDLVDEDLRGAVERLEEERARVRKRSARFGRPYVEPNPFSVLTRTEVARLRKLGREGRSEGVMLGVDLESEEEKARRERRAKRFGSIAPSAAVSGLEADPSTLSRLEFAGEGAEAASASSALEERAKRFGVVDVRAKAAAEAAAAALLRRPGAGAGKEAARREEWAGDPDVKSGKALLGGGEMRRGVLHVTCARYLQASNSDILAFFEAYRPRHIEWLNGEAVNVIFADDSTMRRAYKGLFDAIPEVEDVPPVPQQWRQGVRPLLKRKRDKYGPAGAETFIWARPATEHDSKEKAVATGGARVWGSWLNRKKAPLTLGPKPKPHSHAFATTTALLSAIDKPLSAPRNPHKRFPKSTTTTPFSTSSSSSVPVVDLALEQARRNRTEEEEGELDGKFRIGRKRSRGEARAQDKPSDTPAAEEKADDAPIEPTQPKLAKVAPATEGEGGGEAGEEKAGEGEGGEGEGEG